MFERFTDRARKAMALANYHANRMNHQSIGTEHLLIGLVAEGSGVAANVLKNLGVDLQKVRLEVEKQVDPGPDRVNPGKLPMTPGMKRTIDNAIKEARSLNHNYVGTEHLLLGLLREHEGVAAQVLMNLNLKLDEVREEVLKLLGTSEEMSGRPMEVGWTTTTHSESQIDEAAAASTPPALPLAVALDRVFAAAQRQAAALGHDQVRPAVFLIGLIEEPSGEVARVLEILGVSREAVSDVVRNLYG